MNFLKIAWRDISSIFKNRIIRVSVIAIIIVPLLYSLLYLDAFWDPYNKWNNVPVAVVNLDRGSTQDGKAVNYGRDIVDNLKTNNQVGWKFVSEEDATKGLRGSKYYAAFIIPKDFSEKILSAKYGRPEQPKILFTSNDKKNFLAASVNSKVELELKAQIIKNITENYTKVTFDNLYDIKDGFDKAADGSKTLSEKLGDAKDGSEKITEGLGKINSSVPELKDGVNKLYKGSTELNSGLAAANSGAIKLRDGISTAKSGLDSALKNVGSSTEMLSFITNPSTIAGTKKLMADAASLKDADTSALNLVPQLATPQNMLMLGKLANDYKQVNLPGIINDPLFKGLPSLTTEDNIKNINSLINDTETLSKIDASKLVPIMSLLGNADSINKLLTDAQGLGNVDVNSMSNFLTEQKTAAQSYVTAANQLNTTENRDALKGAIATNSNISDTEKSHLSNLVDGYYNLTSQTKENMTASAEKMNSMSANLKMLSNLQNELKNSETVIKSAQTALSPANIGYLKSVLPKLMTMKQDLDANKQNLDALKSLLAKTNDPSTKETLNNVMTLQNDLNQVSPIINTLQGSLTPDMMVKLAQSPQLVNQLLAMQKDLKDNEKLIEVAQNALTDGNISMAKQLIGTMPSLMDGVNKLYNGSNALAAGTQKLYAGSSQLTGGLSQLNSKVPELANGANQLYTGSSTLSDGLGKLSDGAKELNTKLADGAKEIGSNLKISSDDMGKFVSEPLAINEQPINPVKDYGSGFAPYFIPLSLWVGALMMFFVITDKVDDDLNASSASIVAGKYISYGYIGIMQAVLASIAVLLLGLKPQNVTLFFVFNIFMSFVFIAIIQCLVFLLGQAGRLLSIVLLILQLTSCAGTFPLEVVPKFFKVLNPFMPFTYCVSGLREIISGLSYATLSKDVTILACVLAAFLIISILFKGHADKVQALFEEKKDQIA